MKIKMILIAMLVNITALFAQYEFTASVQNQTVNGTDFTFDIYMQQTGAEAIYLGQSDFAFTFNNENFTSAAATVEADLSLFYGSSATVISPNIIVVNINAPAPGNQSEFDAMVAQMSASGNGSFIATVKISTISNPSGFMGLAWRTSGLNSTKINRFDNSAPWAQSSITSSGTYSGISDTSLPVDISSFSARCEGQSVIINWTTESETDNLGFILERSLDKTVWTTIASYQTDDALKGQGNTSSATEYTFTDSKIKHDATYAYRLSDVNTNGKVSVYSSLNITVDTLPKMTDMEKAYPNPFNPQTHIAYHLAKEADVEITVFNILGRQIKTLHSGRQVAGSYHVYWNATNNSGDNVPTGTFLICMQAGDIYKIQKVLLIK